MTTRPDDKVEKFSSTNPKLQIVWSPSSLERFQRCPRYYQYTDLEGWAKEVPAPPLWFGGAYHTALEVFEVSKSRGLSKEEALELAIKAGLERCLPSDDTKRTKLTLVRTLVWYAEQYENDTATVVELEDGTAGVEVNFHIELPLMTPDGNNYILRGHVDKLVNIADQTYTLEYKHTARYLDDKYYAQFSPNVQVSAYDFAGAVLHDTVGVVLDATQVLVNSSRFKRRIIQRGASWRQEWLKGILVWLRVAELYAELNFWPMNETSCDMYGGCAFRDVCSKEPETRQMWLKAEFPKKKEVEKVGYKEEDSA